MTKNELRKQAQVKRNAMDNRLVIKYGGIISNNLIEHEWFLLCRSIFVYVSIGNEVPTDIIIKNALDCGKTVSLPRLCSETQMHAVPVRNFEHDIEPGKFGIPEPKSHLEAVPETDIDLIIVPCLLIDRSGYRIGYGKGYYDRYLSRVERLSPHCKTIGLAYHNQIVPSLPHSVHDKPVMLVITEKEMLYRRLD